MDEQTNLERLHAALEPLTVEERRIALDYLLGAVSEAVAPAHWDLATGWALDFARTVREVGRLSQKPRPERGQRSGLP